MKKIILLFFGTLISFLSTGQVSLTTINEPAYNGGNGVTGNSCVTFVIENTNSSAWLLSDLEVYFQTASNGAHVDLWYSASSLSGAPTVGSPTWTKITATSATISVPANGYIPVFSNLNFIIPGNTSYRFAVQSDLNIRYSGTAAITPNSFSSGGLILKCGDAQVASANVGYGGAFPTPPNTPRYFTGAVSLYPAGPCVNPPVAGATLASSSSVCVGGNVNLSLSGTSFGTGQSIQWQSSPDNISWTDISGATSASTLVNPTANTWYRAAVTCGSTTYSTPVQVLTQGGPLSGTYTINKNIAASATNFQSFDALTTALSCGSLSGTVTVNVVPGSGPYQGRLVLNSIPGSGPSARLIINGNGNTLTSDGPTSTDRTTVLLDGADYITIDSLRIEATGATYGWPLQLTGGADSNEIRSCVLVTSTTSTSSNHSGLVLNGSLTSATTTGNAGNYNLFENNQVIGGYYGVLTASTTTTRNVGNTFRNNAIQDFYFYGMYNVGQDSLILKNNDISRPTRAVFSTGYGIYTSSTGNKTEIAGNWIHGMFSQGTNTTTTMYGIYNSSSDNTPGNEGLVYNNLISDNSNDGPHYMIYNSSSDGWKYYHNTVVEDNPLSLGGLTRGFYQVTAATGIEFKNNLIYINRGGADPQYAVYAGTTTSVMDIDHNAYYVAGAGSTANNHYGYYSGDKSSLADWQTATSYDAGSVAGDPLFDAGTLYKPTAAYFNNIGLNLQASVPVDYGSNARGAFPDPGIWEFTPPPGPDMIVYSMMAIGGVNCGSSTNLELGLQNIGTDTVLSFNLNWKINGVVQSPIAVVDTFITGQIRYYTLGPVPLVGTSVTSVEASMSNIGPGTETDASNNLASLGVRVGYTGNLYIKPLAVANDSTFNTFEAMSQALMANGVCGPVTVHVQPGSNPFNEQLKLGEIPGASATNRISIQGHGNTLQYLATSSGERGTIMLNGTDYLRIDSLNIKALGSQSSEYGFGISLYNDADYNQFRYNSIEADQSSTSTNFAGVVISASPSSATTTGKSGSNNQFIGNTIKGGYYGVALAGSTTEGIRGNLVEGNDIRDYYVYGVYAIQQDSLSLLHNEMRRPVRSTVSTFYGAYLSSASNKSRIDGNRIHHPFTGNTASTSSMYGIYLTGFNAATATPNVVSNNMIYAMNGAGSIYGLYISTSENNRILHNTIALIDPVATPSTSAITRGIYHTGTVQSLEIMNNLVAVDRMGGSSSHLVYLGTMNPGINLNYNAYYKGPNASAFGYYGSDVQKLNQWQSLSAKDLNSMATNPFFVDAANDNYIPQTATFDGMAWDVGSVVPQDINGLSRGAIRDPGAIEFTGLPCSGLSGVSIASVMPTTSTFVWSTTGPVDVEWGPEGFQQGTGTGSSMSASGGTAFITGLTPNTCYDVYLKQTCTSGIQGAPPVLGPYSICTPCLTGGLTAGTYTIGGPAGPSNFATVDTVIDILNGCGIQGPVVFTVMPGVYNLSKSLGFVSGSSAVNTITFDGSASLADSIVGTGDAVFDLDGARYLHFDGLSVINTTGRGFWLHNDADSISIENCMIYLNETGSSSANAGIVASASATSLTSGAGVDALSALGNTIVGGYYGIVSYGNGTTAKVQDVHMEDNNLLNQYYYGIYTYYNDNISIRNNQVTGLRNTSSYGVYSIYSDNFAIENNLINDAKTYGVYLSQANSGLSAAPAQRSTFVNNMIAVQGSGAYFTTVSYLDVFHNNIEGSYGYRQFTPTDMEVRNNIFVALSNYAFESGTAVTSPSVLDYNIYHKKGGTTLIKDGTPTYTNLAAWKAAVGGLNVYSLEGDPLFKSPTDLHVLGTLANDAGDNSVGVLTDFDGQTRPMAGSTAVDMGADEYTPLSTDIALVGAGTTPGNNACGDSLSTVELSLSNYGLNTLTGIPVTVVVSGATSASFTGTFTGSINSLGDTTLSFGPLNTAAGGTYDVLVYTNMPGDQDHSNDSLRFSVSFRSILAPVATAYAGNFCTGDYDTLYAPSGTVDNYEWRDVNGVVIGTGEKLAVGPLLSNDTTFLLATTSQQYSLGPVGTSIGSAGNFTDASVQQLYFTAHQQFVLDSLSVFPNGNGNVNINLVDFASNTILQTVTVAVTGVTTPGSKVRIPVGMTIPAGTYKLHGGGSTTGGLWRNTTGAVYPYSVAGVVDITGHSFAATGPNYYYYFYDWKITAGGCPKPAGMITLINTGTATAAFSYNIGTATALDRQVSFDASASVGATTYSWDFGDGQTGSGANVQHSYTSNGTYTVSLSITSSCGVRTLNQQVVIQGIGLDDNLLSRSLQIYPNPASERLSISFSSGDAKSVIIRVLDMAGREVVELNPANLNGSFTGEIYVGNLARGVYSLQIFDGENYAHSRLIKQ